MALQKNQTRGQTMGADPKVAEALSEPKDDAVKEAKAIRKEAKKKAFLYLKTIASAEGADPKMAEALKIIRPSLYGERVSGGGKAALHTLFVTKVIETGKEGFS